MFVQLYCGGGELVGLLQNPHDMAKIWSRSQFEYDPTFAVVNLWGAGNRALSDHDLFEVEWQPELYPVRAVDVREGFSADMQFDLIITMVLHLHAWDEKHLTGDHIQ